MLYVNYILRNLGRKDSEDFLGGQWVRIHLLMQGHRFHPWSRKMPHVMEQLSPCATTTESVLWSLQAATTDACVL